MSEENAAIETDEQPAVGDDAPPHEAAPVDGSTVDGSTADGDAADGASSGDKPAWWHRDHPTFSALAGFYAGLGFIILIPGIFGGLLAALFDQETAEDLFPLVLVTLAVPLALLVPQRTRRFATYMWLGIISTFVVVVGVGALVLWLMINHTG